jgi:hypothetical protein
METSPKVFISYSWKTYKSEVEQLARRLMSDGVDVILDIWDLKEGQDKYAFMESMVINDSINKVLIICDKSYAEKANSRTGGVGDETAIITSEVYGKTNQQKFIPVVFETDEENQPYMPVYLKSRLYILLPNDNEEAYEQLLRNLHGEPISVKPSVGKKPDYITNPGNNFSALVTATKQLKGCQSENRSKITYTIKNSTAEIAEMFSYFSLNNNTCTQQEVIDTIDNTLPFRNHIIDFLTAIIEKTNNVGDDFGEIFQFLYNDVNSKGARNEVTKEIHSFILYELFLSATNLLLHYSDYKQVHNFLTYLYTSNDHYYSGYSKIKSTTTNYGIFNEYLQGIETYYKCQKNNKTINGIGMLVQTREYGQINRQSICDTDLFLCHMMKLLFNVGIFESDSRWFPRTFKERFMHRNHYIMSIWQKMQSRRHCEKLLTLLGLKNIDELKKSVADCVESKENLERYRDQIPYCILDFIDYQDIATLP